MQNAVALDIENAVEHKAIFSKRALWNYGAKALIWSSSILTCLLLIFMIGYILCYLHYVWLFVMPFIVLKWLKCKCLVLAVKNSYLVFNISDFCQVAAA